jgi:hypothetical protein
MNWRRNYYHRNTYKEKFYFSEQEIDFTTEYLDYNQFLLQEFFNADLTYRKRISEYYNNKYGEQSFAYLKRKYTEWANGNYHLTDLMKSRIISFMPQFLTEEAKHKLGVHAFISSIKRTVNSFWKNRNYQSTKRLSNLEELLNLFKSDNDRINNLNPIIRTRLDILSNEEIIEAGEIIRYILKVKLQNAFNQINRDFEIFFPFISNFNRGSISINYEFSFYNCSIELSKSDKNKLGFLKFYIAEIDSQSRYKGYADKYLAYEMVSIHTDNKKAIVKSFLNNHDMNLFWGHYEELAKGESLAIMNATFQGEGGILRLNAEVKPLRVLRISISKSVFKIIVFVIIISGLVSWSINMEWNTLLIWGGIIGGLFGLNFIREEYSQLKTLLKEHRKYGK